MLRKLVNLDRAVFRVLPVQFSEFLPCSFPRRRALTAAHAPESPFQGLGVNRNLPGAHPELGNTALSGHDGRLDHRIHPLLRLDARGGVRRPDDALAAPMVDVDDGASAPDRLFGL